MPAGARAGRCPCRPVPVPAGARAGRCLTCLNCLTFRSVGRVTGFEPGFSFHTLPLEFQIPPQSVLGRFDLRCTCSRRVAEGGQENASSSRSKRSIALLRSSRLKPNGGSKVQGSIVLEQMPVQRVRLAPLRLRFARLRTGAPFKTSKCQIGIGEFTAVALSRRNGKTSHSEDQYVGALADAKNKLIACPTARVE